MSIPEFSLGILGAVISSATFGFLIYKLVLTQMWRAIDIQAAKVKEMREEQAAIWKSLSDCRETVAKLSGMDKR